MSTTKHMENVSPPLLKVLKPVYFVILTHYGSSSVLFLIIRANDQSTPIPLAIIIGAVEHGAKTL